MRHYCYKRIALVLAFIIFIEIIPTSYLHALTSGPVQPEFSGFSTMPNSEMVDLFTGDFNYSIPLMEVPGLGMTYPLNLSYHSVTSSDEEASMVGLGWNLNLSSITRNVNAIPDDFDSVYIESQTKSRKNWTVGLSGNLSFELFGGDASKAKSKAPSKGNLSLSATISYNNYNGVGLSFSPNLSLPLKGSGLSSSFGYTLNTMDAPTMHAGVSYTGKLKQDKGDGKHKFSIGINHNSFTGLKNIAFNANSTRDPKEGSSKGYSYDFAPANIEDSEMEYRGVDVSLGIEGGVSFYGLDPYGAINGFYSEQRLSNNMKNRRLLSFGSMYLQDAGNSQNCILDYSKYNDGPIYENMLNLASAKIDHDIFSVQSPKSSGTFTLERGDIGLLRDAKSRTNSFGFVGSLEVGGGGIVKYGGDIELSASTSVNNVDKLRAYEQAPYKFAGKEDSKFEPTYFRKKFELTGETPIAGKEYSQSYDYIKGDTAIRFNTEKLNLTEKIKKFKIQSSLTLGKDLVTDVYKQAATIGNGKRINRKPRAEVLSYLTNKQLFSKNKNTVPIMEAFVNQTTANNIDPSITGSTAVKRDFGSSKISAMYQTLANGEQWNYAIPVVNHTQREVTYSIGKLNASTICNPTIYTNYPSGISCAQRSVSGKQPNSIFAREDFFSSRTIPSYASSFLLTSILGPDYVDVSRNGPNLGDAGSWFAFKYAQVNNKSNPYKWRTPYLGANVNAGYRNLDEDNKASFVYGEKDQFYLTQILSPTHKTYFYYSKRYDAKGAECWLQDAVGPDGASSYKLDSIRLFSIEQNTSIKTVKFIYDYSLCPNTKNSISVDTINLSFAKLTLREVQIVNYDNTRGTKIPYKFSYKNDANQSAYSYADGNVDRWGVYRNNASYPCSYSEAPYTNQIDNSTDENSRAAVEDPLNNNISAWHLSKIDLPSGAQIDIEVARDHYAYLQDNKASQMLPIAGFTDPEGYITDTLNYAMRTYNDKVYFRLEKPIKNDGDKMKKLDRYFDDLYNEDGSKQIMFKIFSDLTGKGEYEYVTGYANVKDNQYGFGAPHSDGYYYYAYVNLEKFQENIKGMKFHPFYVFSWQLLKMHLRRLLFRWKDGDVAKKREKIDLIMDLGKRIVEITNICGGFYTDCIGLPITSKNRGQTIDLNKSFIKLNNSDGFKYGDGVRVTKITIKTNWCDEATPLYGFVYDYTKNEKITNRDGTTSDVIISSGVANNEPYVGSEENSYKYAKSFKQQVIWRTDELSFQEYPVNIDGLPGPGVGYSQVTVRSLASDFMLKKANNQVPSGGLYDIPFAMNQISSKGQTVHEFYTSKDFPTVFKQTSLEQNIGSPRFGLIPLIGSLKNNKVVSTQGYATERNDMHGKQKKVTYYSQTKTGLMNQEPVSYTEYIYKSRDDVYQRGSIKKYRKRLNNDVSLFDHYKKSDRTGASLVNGELGVNRSVNAFLQHNHAYSGSLGADINLNGFLFAIFPGFVPTVWPSANLAIDNGKTGVVNKIIERTGIIDSIRVFDGTSLITTKNLVFDPIGGGVVLSSVQNQFNNPVYNYNIPARYPYPQMGPGYENIGFNFKVAIDSFCLYNCDADYMSVKLPAFVRPILRPGDEYLVTMPNDTMDIAYCVFNDASNARIAFDSTKVLGKFMNLPAGKRDLNFYIIRSGKRNRLDASAASISALCDPTTNYIPTTNGGTLNSTQIFSQSYRQDNCILDAKVSTYSEFWDQAYTDNTKCDLYPGQCFVTQSKSFNPYRRGVRGIWQPDEMLAYLTDRKYDTTSQKFEHRGVYPSMTYFQWDDPKFRYTVAGSNWITTDDYKYITSTSNVLEQSNALFIPQAALMGYYTIDLPDGYAGLPPLKVTAVVDGSQFYESAYASFEQYENRIATPSFSPQKRLENTCHFDYFSNPNGRRTQIYNVIYSDANGYCIDKPWNFSKQGALVEFFSTDFVNYTNYLNVINSDGPETMSTRAHKGRVFSKITINSCSCPLSVFPFGKVAITDTFRTPPLIPTIIDTTDYIGHTGRRSLVMSSQNTSTDVTFTLPQKTLDLIKNKKYYFSCWVHIPGKLPDFKNLGIAGVSATIFFSQLQQTVLFPEGNIINKWQKIEGYFTASDIVSNFSVIFNKPKGYKDMYIDDVRIVPAESKMTAYVYDPKNDKLWYVLDDNNYYTKYVYDNEGMLIGVMRETEKGVKTIQEYRKYLPDVPKTICVN